MQILLSVFVGRARRHRPVPYLNNVLEQDHRAIKRRVNASQTGTDVATYTRESRA